MPSKLGIIGVLATTIVFILLLWSLNSVVNKNKALTLENTKYSNALIAADKNNKVLDAELTKAKASEKARQKALLNNVTKVQSSHEIAKCNMPEFMRDMFSGM